MQSNYVSSIVLYVIFSLPTSQQAKNMKRKGCHLPESPQSSSKSKLTKKNTGNFLETHLHKQKYLTDDYESENDEDDILSLSDIWCNFDGHEKVSKEKDD